MEPAEVLVTEVQATAIGVSLTRSWMGVNAAPDARANPLPAENGARSALARSAFSTYWTVTVTVFVERPYWFVAYKV